MMIDESFISFKEALYLIWELKVLRRLELN